MRSKQGLWRVLWHNSRKQTSFRTVLVQIAGKVPEGSGSAGGALQPSRTSSAICTRTFRNFISICTGRKSLELHQLSPSEPSGTLSSAPEPSGTSSTICPETLRKVISHLHRNPAEPHQVSKRFTNLACSPMSSLDVVYGPVPHSQFCCW